MVLMPEGDTIFRTARALDRALAGRTITRTDSVLPALARAPGLRTLEGRTIERVAARGKHLLIFFSGDFVLRSHLRMHGSWHLYRRGDRWKRPRSAMRVLLQTADVEAVAFDTPDAQLIRTRDLERLTPLATLGPDLLSDDFDAEDASRRLRSVPVRDVASALLDQKSVAGIGNVLKSEILFVCGVNPTGRIGDLPDATIARLIDEARRLLRISVALGGAGRRTTGRMQPDARLWVYGRAGKPCRRCGSPVQSHKQGPDARSTYWCPTCQPSKADGPPKTI
jgi:endonuclease-8